MNFIRKLLFPISILYWLITYLRNWCYDIGLFKSQSYEIPIIAVGNLSVGGTGKTPHIEYLIRLFHNLKVATLSRGYKRTSKGFVLADASTNAALLGDEPFQFYSKFPKVAVAVDVDRRNGITQLQKKANPDVILLDDAFQHRKVKAGFYILLTTFNDLFVDDYILPFGNLREPAFGKKRANLIIVTKCPIDLSELAQKNIRKRLNTNLPVYFSTIVYDNFVYNQEGKLEVAELTSPKVILAGIANPSLFFNHLKQEHDTTLVFPDHHDFSEADILKIKNSANNQLIITTEKDFMRLKGKIPNEQLYYLPIKTELLSQQDDFNATLLHYVGKSSRNRSVYSK